MIHSRQFLIRCIRRASTRRTTGWKARLAVSPAKRSASLPRPPPGRSPPPPAEAPLGGSQHHKDAEI
eukprot:1157831-Pyramimonas_sp.AAC.1